jgi:hypothetical protein
MGNGSREGQSFGAGVRSGRTEISKDGLIYGFRKVALAEGDVDIFNSEPILPSCGFRQGIECGSQMFWGTRNSTNDSGD